MSVQMENRYTARSHTLPDGGTETVLIDWVGNNSRVATSTKAQDDALFQTLSDFFDAGVERYGSVDEFTRAMQAYNAARSVVGG